MDAGSGLVVGVRAPGEEAPALVERVLGDVTDHQRAAVLEPAQQQVGAVARMLVLRIVGSGRAGAAARSAAPSASPLLVAALVDRDPVGSIAGERVRRHRLDRHELAGGDLDDAQPSFVRLLARGVGRPASLPGFAAAGSRSGKTTQAMNRESFENERAGPRSVGRPAPTGVRGGSPPVKRHSSSLPVARATTSPGANSAPQR